MGLDGGTSALPPGTHSPFTYWRKTMNSKSSQLKIGQARKRMIRISAYGRIIGKMIISKMTLISN